MSDNTPSTTGTSTPATAAPASRASAPGSPVYVIGGGPGGLATAAVLGRRGIRAVVLEKSDAVGASWRGHYDRLELHTTRRLSALPGLPIPRSYGRWVGRDDLVRYLEQYVEHHRLEIVTGVEVTRIERPGEAARTEAADPEAAQGETAGSERAAPRTADAERARGEGTGGSGAGDGVADDGRASDGRAGDSGVGDSRTAREASTAPSGPAAPETDARWLLRATGGRELTANSVVVATGFNHTPYLPDWPGRDRFGGELLHASDYRNAAPYRGRDVLVVGTGNTGADIAVDLAEGGAARVRLAVRTAPHIVRRTTAGWPAQATGVLVRRLKPSAVDRAARTVAKLSVPDLAEYGLPRPESGLYSRVLEGAIPVQDIGLIEAIRSGRVEPVAAVESFEGDKVVLADGTPIAPEVVMAATGYRRGLESLVGHLGVLDERGRPVSQGDEPPLPGLFFTGYTNPISGMLRELALDAHKIAQAVESDPGERRSA
ncbi:NAD(P)/FAD-dependent oxidoreductase [Streptomyces pathocidini]|uniref:flavin-containing monooxygenase n=1 Tax=Streptomyces pathocidini TaxID=1650571 RepID=UPI0033EDAA98